MIKIEPKDMFDERCRAVVYLLGNEVSSRRFYLAMRKSPSGDVDTPTSASSVKWDGYGGLYMPSDKDIYATAVRKLKEKAGNVRVTKKNLVLMGRVKVFLSENQTTDHDREVFFFVARTYSKYPEETEKMGKARLWTVYDAPFELMRPADALIIRSVLSGKKVEGSVHLTTNESGTRVVARSNLIVACSREIP